MNHSPGPWTLECDDKGRPRRIIDNDGEHVTFVSKTRYVDDSAPDPEAASNARLIAAAPELLAALEDLLRFVNKCNNGYVDRAERAIAKAKGE